MRLPALPELQLIHFVFVPAIWWTYLQFNGSFFLTAVYSLYYLMLEPFAGLTWTGLVALPLWALANWFRGAVPSAWAWALGLHAFSWFAQIVFGHHMAEHRRPALLDSFFQSLVLAPLFVWFELLFLLNYRRRLRAEVQAVVDANIKEWKKHHQPLIAGADIGAQDSCAAGKE
ncbi:hypothetical protein CHLNCDRAFT_145142 [Chlorella variabilis]|uniref:DUF962 domain-containing protein n=1 Tax=Chlorella variabilis TaxID=554065 RepID=E1ZCP3_CHLVA|nr:hypothetical protein CHLNCDRAFT_145142 [Chlorella variabilis]EFN56276.1 hypothetical protein CHLNCDRAFT_145142 [Chlorella variabilis]|eukprot:XP_005848378.1 hypothetical protein CHLNCDRAFT_145142 [Chlorella variabilis]